MRRARSRSRCPGPAPRPSPDFMYTPLHRQQELLVLVAARLAVRQALRARRSRKQLVQLATGGPNPAYLPFSPTGLVPCLHDGDVVVWESLAIAEYLAERHPGMWPADPKARAFARSMCAEMHAGFRHLRNDMTMCIRERVDVRPWSPGLVGDIDRVLRALDRGAAPLRRRRAVPVRLVGRSPTRSSRRSRSASRPTPSSPRTRRARTGVACSRTRTCASGRVRRWPRRRSSRSTSRATSTATSCGPRPPLTAAGTRKCSDDRRDPLRAGRRAYARPRRRARRSRSAAGAPRRSSARPARRAVRHAGLRRHRRVRADGARHHRARRHAARRDRVDDGGGRADARLRAAAVRPRRNARRRDRHGPVGPASPVCGCRRATSCWVSASSTGAATTSPSAAG